MLREVKIEADAGRTNVYLDGRKVSGVRSIEVKQGVGSEIPQIELELVSSSVNIAYEEADVKFSFPNGWVKVEECKPKLGESVLALVRDRNGFHEEVLSIEHIEESDAIYEGDYWCSYRTMNIEALGISKVVGWQKLPKMEVL